MSFRTKQDVRRSVRFAIATLSIEERAESASHIFNEITTLTEVQNSHTIALFISLNDEPQTQRIIDELSKERRVVIPRIEGNEMEFYDLSQGVKQGSFGIMEPLATTPIEADEIDVMVVPGVAFTRRGERCGRGKGFYDKYMSRNGFRAYTIGICHPCQIVDELPTEKHDKRVDKVIFPKRATR